MGIRIGAWVVTCMASRSCLTTTTRFLRADAHAGRFVRTPASQFVDALEEALSGGGRARGPVSVRRAVRVLNLAEVNADPIAKVVLAVSAIEGLARISHRRGGRRLLPMA